MVIAIFAFVIMALPVGAVDDGPLVAVSRINSRNTAEFIEIHNYSTTPVEISELNIRVFNSAGNQNFSRTMRNSVFAPGGFIVIAQSGALADFDESFTANSITPQGGRIEIWLDGQMESDICWGTIDSCAEVITIADSDIFMSDRCQDDEICANETTRFGGLSDIVEPTLPCEYNYEILADDPACVAPTDPTDPIDPPINHCAGIMITEIGANLDEENKFIEIFNPTDAEIDLTGCRVEVATGASAPRTFVFDAESLDAGEYRVIGTVGTAIVINKTTGGTICILSTDGQVEESCVTYGALKANTSWALIGDVWQETTAMTPGAANPLPKPLNLCEGLTINEIGANIDEQFIEIANSTNAPVDLTDCRLMTNRSATKYYEFGVEILSVGALKVVKIADTELTLTKTTAGTVYILSSDGQAEVDAISYSNLTKNTSWALVGDGWVQTFNITMGRENVYQEFPACQEGYFRNLETGRCNKFVEPSVPAPCAAGQYRNPETNRCRKIETGSTLAPCQEGYERNPLTNRCRKITTDTGGLKPCAEGYERNPDTNRCRKITSSEPGQYAVRIDPPGANSLWQWVGGGIVAATIAIVILQYRMEIGQFLRRLLQKIGRQKFATGVE